MWQANNKNRTRKHFDVLVLALEITLTNFFGINGINVNVGMCMLILNAIRTFAEEKRERRYLFKTKTKLPRAAASGTILSARTYQGIKVRIIIVSLPL